MKKGEPVSERLGICHHSATASPVQDEEDALSSIESSKESKEPVGITSHFRQVSVGMVLLFSSFSDT